MQIRRFISCLLVFLLITLGASAQHIGRWERLGERKVDFRTEKDVIKCSSSKAYTAIKIRTKDAAVQFDKVIIHYQNGSRQDVAIRKMIPAGGETRVIDLPGNKRIIKDVTFYYRSKKGFRGKARVEVWGRR